MADHTYFLLIDTNTSDNCETKVLQIATLDNSKFQNLFVKKGAQANEIQFSEESSPTTIDPRMIIDDTCSATHISSQEHVSEDKKSQEISHTGQSFLVQMD